MLRTVRPKNARSKRALDARAPKEIEDARTAIFVKGTHAGERVSSVMKDLMALKRPHCISFSKKNDIHPFDATTSSSGSTSQSSLEFWAAKNDASLFVIGQTTKKRPHGLTLVRMYDGRVLDMCEVGVEEHKSMDSFKTPKPRPGNKPLMHFASELFDTHPRFIQLKSLLISLFNGEVIDSICLNGLEHVISVSLSPTPAGLTTASPETTTNLNLPKVHIRAYTTQLLPSGTRVPRVELTPMGPALDLVMRRHQDADTETWKQAMKRPKVVKKDIESGLGKKRKNMEVDEMGDLRGRVHVGKQDLSKLVGKKMKGLKKGSGDDNAMDLDGEDAWDIGGKKKRKIQT
ncbi:rRNA-binding ribosome biosynthesis protein rpf2 [Pleurotus ostreatus]|uniref:Ribosome production factor 2 homolog n=1 Tax=Pleurotus ostreatus TaxID=5322 RepID=A0A8H7DVT7_PLEOS|nr:rRNA-binding ribosome biosynthesis protein rpf2 [Pleurotus ostreatus]KAF7433780.1 rRNA-binding ribosome biosynthesis protein rpf2 [Pleurotus ostreatus]